MKIIKEQTIKFISLLKRDYTLLCKKDEFQASVLNKIIENAERHLRTHQWEVALEYSLISIYKYDIGLKQETIKAIIDLLEKYNRPIINTQGQDLFEEIKAYYKEIK